MPGSRAAALAVCVLAIGGALSLVLPEYYLRLLNLSVISAVSVVGLNIAFGYAGLISLGHAAFVGLGAYVLAILTTRIGLSPWLAMPASVAVTLVFAIVIGLPLLRLKGHYLALATLGLNVSFVIVASNWLELTGGTNGISQIPPFHVLSVSLTTERGFLWLALAHSQPWQVIAAGIWTNAYISLAYGALPALVVSEVDGGETGVATGVNAIARTVGSAIAAAVVAVLLGRPLATTGTPPEHAFVTIFIAGAVTAGLAMVLIAVSRGRQRDVASAEAKVDSRAMNHEWG